MRQLSMTPSAIAQREKYAAAKAAKLAALDQPTNTPIETSLDNAGKVEVEIAPNEPVKPSLKERLFGGTSTPLPGSPTKAKTVKKGQRGKQIDASLLAKTFPTMIATITASYAQRLIKDPYKPCAPSEQEVVGVIGPLFSILSRRIEIVGTASEDIIDLISSVLAGLVAGIRIHITYLSISETVEKAKQNGHVANTSAGTSSNRLGGDNGTKLDSSRAASIPVELSGTSANVEHNDSNLENGHSGATKPEVELFAQLAQRDRNGRVRLGLLSE